MSTMKSADVLRWGYEMTRPFFLIAKFSQDYLACIMAHVTPVFLERFKNTCIKWLSFMSGMWGQTTHYYVMCNQIE